MSRHPLAIASACYVLIALVLSGPALIGRAALGPDQALDWDPLYRTGPGGPIGTLGDLTPIVFDYPRDLAFARALHAGRFDLWNPLTAAGSPLWVESVGPFFPLKLVFYAAPSRQTYHLFLALRLVIAALGAYLLARWRGQEPLAALASGATFELCGALIAQLPFGNSSAVYLLPWVILGSFAIAQWQGVRATVGTAIGLALVAVSGHLTLILMVFAAFAAAIAGHCVAAWRRPATAVSIAGHATLAVALAALVAAVSLLPLLELANVGSLYKDWPIGENARSWSLRRSRALLCTTLFASRALGTLPDVRLLADLSPSIGTLALFAAITGTVAGRVHLALLSVALLGIAIALAPPLLGALLWLPGLRWITAIYAWPLIALPATQAVGDGIGALASRWGWRRGTFALVALILGGVALQRWRPAEIDMFQGLLAPLFAVPAALPPWALPAAGAATALGACALFQRANLGRLAAVLFAAAIVAEQLFTVAPLMRRPPSTVLASPPSAGVQLLQQVMRQDDTRFVGMPIWVGYPMSPMLFGLPDLRGNTGLPIRRYLAYMEAINPKVRDMTIQGVVTLKSPLLDLAAARYIVLDAESSWSKANEPAENDPTLVRIHDDRRVRVYENRAAFPRVRVVHRAVRVPNEAAARTWLNTLAGPNRAGRSEAGRELGWADAIVLEPDDAGVEAPAVSGDAPVASETVRLVDHPDPDRLLIEAQLEQPGFVVIADTYYPGWTAWVDGTRTSVFPANLLFRAVYVDHGTHTVELRYQPKSFLYGGLVSVAAALCCVFAVVRGRRLRFPVAP